MTGLSRLIWADSVTDLSVAVNGGQIEIALPDGWCPCLPSQISELGSEFAAAIAKATAITERWDTVTGCYRDVEVSK